MSVHFQEIVRYPSCKSILLLAPQLSVWVGFSSSVTGCISCPHSPARYLQPQVEQTTGVPLETLKEESDKEKKQEEEKEKADKEKGEKEAKEPEKIRRVPSSRERNNKIHKAETHSAIVCKPFSHVSGQNSSAAR